VSPEIRSVPESEDNEYISELSDHFPVVVTLSAMSRCWMCCFGSYGVGIGLLTLGYADERQRLTIAAISPSGGGSSDDPCCGAGDLEQIDDLDPLTGSR